MEEREHARIMPDLDVIDADGQKVGTVAHVYEPDVTSGVTPAAASPSGGFMAGEGIVEVKTGLFGLGKHYFIPFSAVKDVTPGGIFVDKAKTDFDKMGWQTKQDLAVHSGSMDQVVSPARSTEIARPQGGAETSPLDWSTVAPHFRMRWSEHYGTHGAQWETYEPRYRYAWEMSQRPEYRDRSWISAQPDLRLQWEVLHPEQEWDTVADTVRDAWEHPPATASTTSAAGTAGSAGTAGTES